jgi:hypothetical protein
MVGNSWAMIPSCRFFLEFCGAGRSRIECASRCGRTMLCLMSGWARVIRMRLTVAAFLKLEATTRVAQGWRVDLCTVLLPDGPGSCS